MSSQFPGPNSLRYSTSQNLLPEISLAIGGGWEVVGVSDVRSKRRGDAAMQMTSAGPAVSRAKPNSTKRAELISAWLDAFPQGVPVRYPRGGPEWNRPGTLKLVGPTLTVALVPVVVMSNPLR